MERAGDKEALEDFPAILDDAEEEAAAGVQVDGEEEADAQRRYPHRQAAPQPMAMLRDKVTLAQEAVNVLEQTVKGGGSEGGGAAHGAVKAAYDKALAAYQRAMQLIPQGDGDAQEIVATKAELAKMKADLDHFSESFQLGSDAANDVDDELSMTGTAQVSVEVLLEEETSEDFAQRDDEDIAAESKAAAKREFKAAKQMRKEGRFSDAVEAFERAAELYEGDDASQKLIAALISDTKKAAAKAASAGSEDGEPLPGGNRPQDPDAGPTGGGSNHDAPAATGSSSNTAGLASTSGGNGSGSPAGEKSGDAPVDQDFSELDDETEGALVAYNHSVAELERELESLKSLNFKPHEYATTPAVLLKAKALADSAKALFAIEADGQEVKDKLRGHLTQVMEVINPDGYTPTGEAAKIVREVAEVLEQVRGPRLTDSAEEKSQDTYDPVERAKGFAAQARMQDDAGLSIDAAAMYEEEAEAWLEAQLQDLLEQSRKLHLQSLTRGAVVQNDSAHILKQISRLIRLDDPVTQDRVDTVGAQLQQQREMLREAPELSGSDLHDSLAEGLKQVMDAAGESDNEALIQRAEASVAVAKKVLGGKAAPDVIKEQLDRLDAIKHSRLSEGSGPKKQ